ncbi:unnamed protein product [Durusdinium trenchii]|uniref:Metallo-beta-lactamase domain-containing protein n=1 Tax=Durusdinium trenchii TaxID=1381693 RepID=A0ABP0Q306_9DINO
MRLNFGHRACQCQLPGQAVVKPQACAAHAPPELPKVAQMSERVTRVLGRNPSPFALTGTNLYLVGTGEARILVDVGEGKPGVLQDLLQTMEEQGCKRLSQVVITHWHFDHIGGVPELLRHFGNLVVRKFMPKEGTAAGESTDFWDPKELLSRLDVQELVDLEELRCEGATLRVLFTPGHANDHVCLFLEEEQALFTGDNVLGWGTGTFQDLQPYMRSLKRMADQAPEVLYPAHGPGARRANHRAERGRPVVAGALESAAWLKMYITHREERIQQVEEELRKEAGLDLIELVKRVYKVWIHPSAAKMK